MTKEEMLALRAMMTEVVQGENQQLREEMQGLEQRLDTKMKAQEERLDAKMKAQEERLNAKIDNKSAQMMMQFAEMLENQTTQMSMRYEHEVSGRINALDEETDILRDDVKDHEQRIHNVERKIGMAI